MIRAGPNLPWVIRAGIRRHDDLRLAFPVALETRALIHILELQKLPNGAISRSVDAFYGAGVIGLNAIQKLTYRFRQGGDNLEDEPRLGHPRSTKYCDAIHTLLDESRSCYRS
jgi:hypothetical protein